MTRPKRSGSITSRAMSATRIREKTNFAETKMVPSLCKMAKKEADAK